MLDCSALGKSPRARIPSPGFKPRRSRFGNGARAGSRSLEREGITVSIMYTVHDEDRRRGERGGDSETSIKWIIIRDADALLEDPPASSQAS